MTPTHPTSVRPTSARATPAGGLATVAAFVRRDFLVSWSYRVSFFSDWFGLLVQMVTFYFLGKMIPSSAIPQYGAQETSYVEFVSIGVALTSFMYLALSQVQKALRQEQMLGTLEMLMISPASPSIIQVGSSVYQAVYVPVRTAVFLGLVSLFFGAGFAWSGGLLAVVVLLAFIPFVWGLGLVGAASTLVVRRGGTAVNLGTTVLTLVSGAYFPVDLLPGWLQGTVAWNPIGLAVDAIRQALLGGTLAWADVLVIVAKLAPMAALTLLVGVAFFRFALARETRRGTLGVY
jgi:ABC-2 type transport system permease protein